jgi:hypothetical protein
LQVLMGLRAKMVRQEFLVQAVLSQLKARGVSLVAPVVTQAQAA